MPAKMAQSAPSAAVSGCQDYGRRPRRQAVLSKRGNSAKIHPGLGFIWGIPVKSNRWEECVRNAKENGLISSANAIRSACSGIQVEAENYRRRFKQTLTSRGKAIQMKRLVLTGIALSVSCMSATAQKKFIPTFDQETFNSCGTNPVVKGNSVAFGSGNQVFAGRVVSHEGYINIRTVTATIDLSKLTSENFINASFYLIGRPDNPTVQPRGDSYCDQGGNHSDFNCREIDFMETNGNKLFQTTIHVKDKKGNLIPNTTQRYEYAFSQEAKNNVCFSVPDKDDPKSGLLSLIKEQKPIDMGQPFDIRIEFAMGAKPGMKAVFQQKQKSSGTSGPVYVVYDTDKDGGAQGSNGWDDRACQPAEDCSKANLDPQDLKTTMEKGTWLVMSFWQGYSPEGPGNTWYHRENSTQCHDGPLCSPNNPGQYWSISNIEVVADSSFSPATSIRQIFVPR